MTYRYVPAFGLRIMQIVILIEAIVRGLMYLLINEKSALELTALEQSAPLRIWGAIFISFAVLGFFGEALMSGTEPYMGSKGNPRAWPSFIAHSGLMILCFTLALSQAASIVGQHLGYHATLPYDLMTLAYLHWMFARRRKTHVT